MSNFITVRNEVGKVMFLHVSVILSTGGISQHALQVVSQHALQQGGIPACIAGGIPACLAAGGCVLSQHALQQRGSAPRGSALGGGPPQGVYSQGAWRPP